MKITEEQSQNVLANIENGEISLSQEEIDELTNTDSLKDYPEDEIKQNAELLENTMKEFQKLDKEYGELKEGREPHYDYDDYDKDDDDYEGFDNNNNKPSKKGIFKLIIKGIQELFTTVGALWYTIFILIILFFVLLIIRKTTDLDNNIRNKNKDKKNRIEKDN